MPVTRIFESMNVGKADFCKKTHVSSDFVSMLEQMIAVAFTQNKTKSENN